MQIELKYGRSYLSFTPDEYFKHYQILNPNRCSTAKSEMDIIRAALAEPIASRRLRDLLESGMKVAVITSDITRPCPSARLLPYILDQLGQAGIHDEDVQVIFGLGTHRPHTEDEKKQLAGEDVYRRVRCIDSDPTDVVHLGYTQRGTPLNVFRPVLEADLRICLGTIEYHYFAGYSGGYKAVVPGVCDHETIQHNHRMMAEEGARAGELEANPVRQDIDEAGAKIGVDFLFNVILDEKKNIVHAVSGHPLEAHRAGCRLLDSSGRSYIERPADLVIASAGGYPKDINLYQAQKALDNAGQIIRDGGVIILVAQCPEGLGNDVFQEWMQNPAGPEMIVERIKEHFVLGGHKAAAIASIMKRASVYLVSDIPDEVARSCHFTPYNDLKTAIEDALRRLGPQATTVLMPEGGALLPSIKNI